MKNRGHPSPPLNHRKSDSYATPAAQRHSARAGISNPKEVDRLQDAARKHSRYGHRDATAILIAYRHGLRVSELCELTWNMIELDGGRIHVRRAKNGVDSTHPLTGKEIRALRQLRRENLQSRYVFNTERGWSGDQGLVPQNGPPDWGIGQTALPNPSAHAAARLRV